MKILLTGGGSGGHFYPLIAVAESINKIAKDDNLVLAKLYFMSDSPYDMESLIENNITFVPIYAGKVRRYASFSNFTDIFKTGFAGVINCGNSFCRVMSAAKELKKMIVEGLNADV